MGWKVSMLLINKPTPVDHQKMLHDLGFENISPIGEKPLESVINPDEGDIYVATYNDNLIICESELPMHYMDEDDTPAKTAMAKLFPSSEVCALVLHSTVNLWGYAVMKNGALLRARAGAAESGVMIDVGEPLAEEKRLLSKSTLHADGSRTFVLNEGEDTYTDDQVGENFVFAVSRRYLGAPLDGLDDLLFETKFKGYSVQKAVKQEEPRQASDLKAPVNHPAPEAPVKEEEHKSNRWMIYAIVIVAVIAWQIFKRVILN